MNRRKFLIGCGAGAAVLASSNLSVMAAPLGLDAIINDDRIFIVVFLRGGADGLQLVAPSSSSIYNDSRAATLKTTDRGSQKGYLLKNSLGKEGFRMHQNAAELYELYQGGQLAVLHACGLTNGTRSHFVAQDLVERGISDKGAENSGWMARYLNAINPTGSIPGLSTSGEFPVSLSGAREATAIRNLKKFQLVETIRHHELFRAWHDSESLVDQTAIKTIDAIEFVKKNGSAGGSGSYPSVAKSAELNESFKSLASLIKMNAGVKVANVDFGGWDHHEHQADYFPALVKALSKSLAAFWNDIRDYQDKTTVLVMSEFGRRLRSNKSGGTDHGYGNAMMVLGGKVNGGRMYGQWPGLEIEQLDRRVDLNITTDYRDVLAEILSHQGFSGNIFPDYKYQKHLGLY